MILGFAITPLMLVLGGSVLWLLMLFQVLQGLRKIKFKGRLHSKVHKVTGLVLLAAGAFHGLLGIAWALGARIG